MKKFIVSLLVILPLLTGAQTILYVPTNGLGTSTNGYVGIGTNNPLEMLHVAGDARFANRMVFSSATAYGGSYGVIGLASGVPGKSLVFYNYDGPVYDLMVLNGSTGNIGIGTSMPNHKLEISGSGIPSLGIKGPLDSKIVFEPGDGSDRFTIWSNTNSNTYQDLLRFGALHSPDILTLRGDGNVGIGSTAPSHKLEISGSGIPSLGIKGPLDSKIVFEPNDGTDRFTIWSNMNSDTYQDLLRFGATSAPDILVLRGNGNVGIGTTSPDAKLAVKGAIHAEEVLIDLEVPAPDYVFEKDYNLLPLSEIECYIQTHKHLPEVPSAKELDEKGLNVEQMNMLLLKKVEELTLHLIEMKKENDSVKERLNKLENK